MTVREWITRCADRFVSRGGMTRQQAETAATACFEANADGADGFDPLWSIMTRKPRRMKR